MKLNNEGLQLETVDAVVGEWWVKCLVHWSHQLCGQKIQLVC